MSGTSTAARPKFNVKITFNEPVQVSDVAIFTQDASNNIREVRIKSTMTIGSTQQETCGTLTMTSAMQNSIACTSTHMAIRVNFHFTLFTTSVNNLCKVAVFGKYCKDIIPTITESPLFAGGTTTFDLLQDTSVNVALPTLILSPAECSFTTTWAIKKLSDDQDMITLLPSVFGFSGSNLVLSHTVNDFAQRKSLFGSDVYYLIGTLSNSASTQTRQF